MNRADDKHGRASVPQRRRRAALKNRYYSEKEMNSRTIGFPNAEAIWSGSESSILINPEQPIRLDRPDRHCSPDVIRVGLRIDRHDDKIDASAGLDTLRAVYRVRQYRFRNIMYESGLIKNVSLLKEMRYDARQLTKHGQSLCRQAVLSHTGYNVQEFKSVSVIHFNYAFGDEVKAMTASHRGMKRAIHSARLRGFLEREQAIISIIERAMHDADHVWGSVSAVFESNLRGCTPTLNSLYRFFSGDFAPATESDVLSALVAISFFGCTNAASIYFEHKALSEVCRVASFLGRVNLGLLQPTWFEAGAYLHLICDRVDHEGLLPKPPQATKILALLQELLDLTPYRHDLEMICEHSFRKLSSDKRCFKGHLWPML